MSTKIGIVGYGNLGRGVEKSIMQNEDMELVAVFSRRDPKSIKLITPNVQTYHMESIDGFKDRIDVLILCGGSATDLPEQTPLLAQSFNVIDSFDNHNEIPIHFKNVDESSRLGSKVSLISVGWDPGVFSLLRLLGNAFLPVGEDYTFWGKGVSQGHSDAIRRVDGVLFAKQYTIPKEEALQKARSGKNEKLTTREKHLRECYVVACDDADKNTIENTIKNMPNYFADYDTIVHFITKDEFERNHSAMPHGGFVLRCGNTGIREENSSVMEFSLNLSSNPEFTASVIVAYARALHRLEKEGEMGCKTIFDIPPKYLISLPESYLIKHML